MHTYTVDLICQEPAAPGFSCETDDSHSFSYAGEPLTNNKVAEMMNDSQYFVKRCWKCFAQNWRVKRITHTASQPDAGVSRM